MICFSCKNEIPISIGEIVGRRDECSSCGADVHVCLNCAFYDPSAYHECRETQADYVKEKDRSNFCGYFSPGVNGLRNGPTKNDLLSAAEALFKKK